MIKLGKAKMKALYRSCGNTYHEGDKAETMIESLNFQRIVDYSPLDLEKLSTALTKPQNIVDAILSKNYLQKTPR